MKAIFFSICAFLISNFAQASDTGFDNLSQSQLEDILGEFSANFVHTTVSPASSLGETFGVEFGLVAGGTKVPEIEKVSKAEDPNADLSTMPHFAFIGLVSIPFGLTFEMTVLPTVDEDDSEVGYRTFAIKWTFSELTDLPLDVSLKLHGSSSEAEFTQDVPVAGTLVEFESQTGGLLLQASKKISVFEPYIGIGTVSGEAEVSATQDIFDNIPGAALKHDEELTGGQFVLGINLNLLFFKFGAEVGKVFESEYANLKTSFYF